MERRFNRQSSNEGRPAMVLQKNNNNQVPDLTDFMNDMFFGTVDVADKKKTYNLSGDGDEDDFDGSMRSVSSRQTQEWLEEARRIVAASPSRGADSPSPLVSSPRFAQARLSTSSLDRRDPFSRSARRNRTLEGTFSGEILSKTLHTRDNLETDLPSPTSEVHKWISNIQIPSNPDPTISPDPTPPSPTLGAPPLPPRQSMHRRSRFQTDRTAPLSVTISSPTNSPAISITKRNFKTSPNSNGPSTISDSHLLSPPKHLVQSAHWRSISSSTCSIPQGDEMLSPPRNLVESAHRRSVSSNTCRVDRIMLSPKTKDTIVSRGSTDDVVQQKRVDLLEGQDLNGFLKEQKVKIEKLLNGEINGRAKIVLSGPSNSTSSMVAAVCYAWFLETKMRKDKKGETKDDNSLEFVLPVMNMRRGKMWRQRQAAWLFHHAGLDATSLLFSNEVDLETLMMSKQLSMLVVGEDILRTNGEVRSACTMITDNYCEDAYDFLQTPVLRRLLLGGILLDTHNLIASPNVKVSLTRDTEAVQLLSVSSIPNYRNTLFDQLMQDQLGDKFFEVLQDIYGKPPPEIKWDRESQTTSRVLLNKATAPNYYKKQNDARTNKVSPPITFTAGKPTPPVVQAPPPKEPPRKNFFQKLFGGFGSK